MRGCPIYRTNWISICLINGITGGCVHAVRDGTPDTRDPETGVLYNIPMDGTCTVWEIIRSANGSALQ